MFYPQPEAAVRAQWLLSGYVDIVDSLDAQSAAAVARGPDTEFEQAPGTGFSFICIQCMQMGPGPLKDMRVRSALSYAIDRAALGATLGPGGVVPDMPLPPQVPGFTPGSYQHRDLAKARLLLTAAGATGLQVELLYADSSPLLAQRVRDSPRTVERGRSHRMAFAAAAC